MSLLLLLLSLTVWVAGPFAAKTGDPLDAIARPYEFNIVTWEGRELLLEGLQQLRAALPGSGLSEAEERVLVKRYQELREETLALRRGMALAPQSGASKEAERLNALLSQRTRELESLRGKVEVALGGRASQALFSEGLVIRIPPAVGLSFVFPPVSFELARPPSVFVVSPRDKISLERLGVLRPDLSLKEMQAIESRAEKLGWSALVEPTGGYSVYPTIIPDDAPFDFIVNTVVHEWLHGYLFFRPLGRNYFKSQEMRTINETVADMAGSEIGGRIIEWYQPKDSSRAVTQRREERGETRPRFDFRGAMRETRLAVDEMLAQGRADDAEVYMELRRRFLAEHGYYIRKLNQAYFAFHGVYGDSPASVSPVGGQLQRLRVESASVGEFVKKMARVSSYEEFLELVGER